MDILNMTPVVDNVYCEPGFKHMLESYLTTFLKSPSLKGLPATPLQQGLFKGNFNLLLLDMGIEAKFHWITMRLNGYTSPYQYDGRDITVLFPDFQQIERLKSLYQAKK